LIGAGADPTAWLSQGNDKTRRVTYLMLASASGSWAMLDDALARPHDIHAQDPDGRTALVWVLWNAPPDESIFPLVDKLRAHGAARSELDTALLVDCNPNWIPGLVARGANVNARDKNGNTPLFQDCTAEAIKALLDAGADATLRNAAGKTVLETTYTGQYGKADPRADLIRHYRPRAKH
jgi:ankyrin repeat protein